MIQEKINLYTNNHCKTKLHPLNSMFAFETLKGPCSMGITAVVVNYNIDS